MNAERPPDNQRRRKLLIAATSATGGVGMMASAVPFVASMLPSERAKAVGAPVEVDLTKIERGTLATVEWRGKPVWILARTPDMLERLRQGEERLLDPQSRRPQQPECCRTAQRSIKPEYFIAVAICTHLGCVPTFLPQAGAAAGPDWPGGFYCPCHGSKFDLAGRVFRGVPAPSNLVIPPHKYLTDIRVLIGEDTP